MLNRDVSAIEQKLDVLIKKIDLIDDVQLQSHLGRYLAIITAGYFEKIIQLSVAEYCNKRATPPVVKFISRRMSWEGSINRAKLKRILDDFDLALYETIESVADEPAKAAVDSIKTLRDQLAHGDENGTSYGTVKQYHAGVRKYAEAVSQTLCA